jgi:hypothetical protein
LGDREAIVNAAKRRMIELIKAVKDSELCDGVHLTIEGYEELIPDIIREAGI